MGTGDATTVLQIGQMAAPGRRLMHAGAMVDGAMRGDSRRREEERRGDHGSQEVQQNTLHQVLSFEESRPSG
jgi:hypothetical protein